MKDDSKNLLHVNFPFDYTLNSKKEEKIKIKFIKKEITNIIGTGEICLSSYSNLKQKKIQNSKKWYNINSNLPSQTMRDSNSSLGIRGLNSANFALNLINTIKIHLKITETFLDNSTLRSPKENSDMEDNFQKNIYDTKSTKENIYNMNTNTSNKSNSLQLNNSLNINYFQNKLKSDFEEYGDSKEEKDILQNKANLIVNFQKKINSKNLNSNSFSTTYINRKSTEEENENENLYDNGKELLTSITALNNFKEKSTILTKSGNSNIGNNSKKAKLDFNLSQSLNSSNFQIIKNNLNNSIIGVKGEEKKIVKTYQINSMCTNEDKEKIEKDKTNLLNNISQNVSYSNNLKKKTISMIDSNLKRISKINQPNNQNNSPKFKNNINSLKPKDVMKKDNINTVRSTTSKNTTTINYSGI